MASVRPKKSTKNALHRQKTKSNKITIDGRVYIVKPSERPSEGRKSLTGAEVIQKARHVIAEFVVIGGGSDKPEGRMTPLEKMLMVDRGVTKKELVSLKDKTKLDYDQLAQVLSVGRATLLNKKGTEKFSASVGEKIVGLADLYSYGYEVFGENERFNEWMLLPNKALGGKAPYDLIHNQFGREEVRNIIGRIEYGVYS